MKRKDFGFTSILLLLYLLAAAIINPLAEFPLVDDWSFALTVKNSLLAGEFKMFEYTSMTLFTHALWGILWCKLAGFSFTVLRLSGMVASFAGAFLVYKWLTRHNGNSGNAFLLSVLFLFNPLYFFCSFTYMTDNTFCVCILASSYFFYQFSETGKPAAYGIAIAFCLSAILIRQLAVFLPLAFLAAHIFSHKPTLKNVSIAVLPFVLSLTVLCLFNYWMSVVKSPGSIYGMKETDSFVLLIHSPVRFIKNCVNFSLIYLFYTGLSLFPASIVYFVADQKIRRNFLLLFGITLMTALSIHLFVNPFFPFQTPINISGEAGLGAFEIFDTDLIKKEPGDPRIYRTLIVLSSLGLSGFLLAAYAYFRNNSGKTVGRGPMLFVLLSFVFYILIVSVTFIFDRYYIPLLPFAFFIFYHGAGFKNRPVYKPAALVFIGLSLPVILYSLAGTYACFSWNRARWEGIHWLMNVKKISPENIDGGLEFNAWYGYSPTYTETTDKRWYWVKNDQYIISFRKYKEYAVIKTLDYYDPFMLREEVLYIGKKLSE